MYNTYFAKDEDEILKLTNMPLGYTVRSEINWMKYVVEFISIWDEIFPVYYFRIMVKMFTQFVSRWIDRVIFCLWLFGRPDNLGDGGGLQLREFIVYV